MDNTLLNAALWEQNQTLLIGGVALIGVGSGRAQGFAAWRRGRELGREEGEAGRRRATSAVDATVDAIGREWVGAAGKRREARK